MSVSIPILASSRAEEMTLNPWVIYGSISSTVNFLGKDFKIVAERKNMNISSSSNNQSQSANYAKGYQV